MLFPEKSYDNPSGNTTNHFKIPLFNEWVNKELRNFHRVREYLIIAGRLILIEINKNGIYFKN